MLYQKNKIDCKDNRKNFLLFSIKKDINFASLQDSAESEGDD